MFKSTILERFDDETLKQDCRFTKKDSFFVNLSRKQNEYKKCKISTK